VHVDLGQLRDDPGQDLGVANVQITAAAVVVVLPGAGEVRKQHPFE